MKRKKKLKEMPIWDLMFYIFERDSKGILQGWGEERRIAAWTVTQAQERATQVVKRFVAKAGKKTVVGMVHLNRLDAINDASIIHTGFSGTKA